MLNVLALAYQGEAADKMPTEKTREKMLHAIFTKYIDTMLNRHKELKRWKSVQVIRWLTFLAKQIQQRNQPDISIESLQPDWLLEEGMVWYKRLTGLVIGLAYGVPTGVVIGQSFGLVPGLCFGLSVGLYWGPYRAQDTKIVPAEALVWAWDRLLPVMFGLLVLGTCQLGIGPLNKQLIILGRALVSGLILHITWGVLSGKQLEKRDAFRPNEGIRRSGKNGLILFLVIGLAAALSDGLTEGPAIGLLGGLLGGIIGGMNGGLEAFAKHFILRFYLAQQGNLPWNLVPFLEEAAERLFLRKMGGNYIFIHRLLLEYFAKLDKPEYTESILSEEQKGGAIRYRTQGSRLYKRKTAARRKNRRKSY